jgi:mRNA degradation ribonuclease J1/J2
MLGICGVNPKNVVIVDNGNVIDLDKSRGRAEIVGKIPTQPVFFSNSLDGSLDKQSLDERRSLSSDGTLVAALVVDFTKSKLVARPVLKAFGSGFTMKAGWAEIEETIISDIEFAVARALQNGHTDIGIVRHVTHDVLNKRLRERFGMSKPVLSIVVQELKQQEVKV